MVKAVAGILGVNLLIICWNFIASSFPKPRPSSFLKVKLSTPVNKGINTSPNTPNEGAKGVGNFNDLSVLGIGIPMPLSLSNAKTSPPGIKRFTSKY